MNWVSIGSGNGLSLVRRQAITWTNDGLLSIGLLETNVSEIWIGILSFSFNKFIWKCRLPEWWWFCPGGDELTKKWNVDMTEMNKFDMYCYLSCIHVLWFVRISYNSACLISVQIKDYHISFINSLAPGRPGCDFKTAIFNLVLLIGIFTSSEDNALRWMPRDLTDDKSTLVQVMAWCRQATSHYLCQCWPSSMLPYGIARPQWVKPCGAEFICWNK